MTIEEWTVLAKLSGDFYIKNEHFSSETAFVDGLHQISFSPEFDNEGKFTGIHELKAVFSIKNQEVSSQNSHIVFEQAKNIVESVAAMASLVTGIVVKISGNISIKHRLSDDTSKYRLIIGANQADSISPPVPLPPHLFTISIPPKIKRVIRWFAHGLATNDSVDRLIALNNALDLLAGMVEDAPGRIRKCNQCGFEEAIGPGLRERVVYYLTSVMGCKESVAIKIYESRLDLTHGRSDLNEEDLRRYRELSQLVINTLRAGIALSLSITLPPIPTSFPFDLPSALLDIEFEEGEVSNEPNNMPE